MKTKINYFVYSLTFVLFSFISCQENTSKELTNKNTLDKKALAHIIKEMKIKADLSGKIVEFSLEYLKENTPEKHIKLKKNTDDIIAFASAAKDYKYVGNSYMVYCSYTDGTVTTTNCGGDAGCAGAATWDCLDSGGCASICGQTKITYHPLVIDLYKREKTVTSLLNKIRTM